MPYIPPDDRERLASTLAPQTSGELTYLISKILQEYTADNGLSYDVINTCIGALECAKLEYYRMLAVGYENEKMAANGPVY